MVKYYEKIDGLRFVAITLVLIEHFARIFDFSAGYYGVDLFFVISGFLITSILLKTKDSFWTSYRNFIGRRVLRIFPIYYFTIFLLLLLQVEEVKTYLFSLLTFTFNYALVYNNIQFELITPFWSLCVEEQFYLFWPFVVLSLNGNYKCLIWITCSIIILSFVQMTFGIITILNPYNVVGIFTRMGSLSFGALAAVLSHTKLIPIRFLKNAIVEYTVVIVLIVSLLISYPIKFFLLACCSFFFVMKAAHAEFNLRFLNRFLTNKLVLFVGSISYGMYIYHMPICYFFSMYVFDPLWARIDFSSFGFLEKLRWNSWLIKLPLYSILTVVVAYLSYEYVEKPILKLKDMYFGYR